MNNTIISMKEKELRFSETAMAVNEDNVESVYEPPARPEEFSEEEDAPMKILEDADVNIDVEDLSPSVEEVVISVPDALSVDFEELK